MDEDQTALQECIQNNIWKYWSSWATQKYYFINDYYAKYAEYISKTEDENNLYAQKQDEYVKSCKDETILNQANEVYGQMQAREAEIGSENIDTDEEYQNLKNRYEDLLYQYDSSYSPFLLL